MRMYDLIEKKKLGKALTQQEIDWMVQGYTQGEIPDYQMSAFLMAVCFQGMNIEETTAMTLSMAHSGQMSDLSGIQGVKVDKHSTGGVGDKTTLIAAPMAAACGIPVAKCPVGDWDSPEVRWISWSPFRVIAPPCQKKNFLRLSTQSASRSLVRAGNLP